MDDDLRRRVSAVTGLTDAFCAEHLAPGYAGLCRELVARLARQAPSPLRAGHAQAWAAGVVLAAARHVYDRRRAPGELAAELAGEVPELPAAA